MAAVRCGQKVASVAAFVLPLGLQRLRLPTQAQRRATQGDTRRHTDAAAATVTNVHTHTQTLIYRRNTETSQLISDRPDAGGAICCASILLPYQSAQVRLMPKKKKKLYK